MDTLEKQQISGENTALIKKASDAVPPQYKGMPSEIVEELWQNPTYIDGEKNRSETARRQIAIEEIKKAEQDREARKQEELKRQYSCLSENERVEFVGAQKDAAKILSAHIRGGGDIENLTPEEYFVLGKLKADYEEFKEENPDMQFSVGFARDIDRSVYDNLAQRLSFGVLENEGKADDWKRADLIREELGVPVQEVRQGGEIVPEKNLQKSREGIAGKDYEEFRVKNGETDIGVFWYEYGNVAAKKLKESGRLEWGRERLYFDIPLSDMEALRDLAFAIAKNEKIPIAFKYLDVQKTSQLDLKDGSGTTRFVANFASVEDAKLFYGALQKREDYQKMKSDRDMDYHGYNLDGVAHYASGHREKREPLKRIIETARKNLDSTYSYYSADGSKKLTISEEQYRDFCNQYSAIPDPEETWRNVNI